MASLTVRAKVIGSDITDRDDAVIVVWLWRGRNWQRILVRRFRARD